jgi:anti-anti-sigma factor
MSVQNSACIEHTTHDSIVVVTVLVDRIRDPEKVNQIKEAMTDVVKSQVCKNLVIDMSRVQFIGSIGFMAFLAMRRVPGIECIVLCNLDPNVRELFLLSRLIPHDSASSAPFHETPSIPSALEWCRTKNNP